MSQVLQAPTDALVRSRVTTPDSNWILRAPAGSGKTTLLVTRFLELLSLVEKPEEILAITFTRKATAEMRERILASLKNPDSAQPANLADAARRARLNAEANRWEVVANPSRLKIQTIESFRRSLVEASPVEAQIAPGTQLVQDARYCYEEAVELVFARTARGRSETAPIARLLALEQYNQTRVKRGLVDLLARRDQWRPAQEGNAAQAPHWLELHMTRLWSMLESEVDARDLATLARARRQRATHEIILDARIWRRVADLCLTAAGNLRRRLPAGLNEEQKHCLATLLAHLKDMDWTRLRAARLFPDLQPSARERARISTIEACLELVHRELRALFAERGLIDLVELGFGATRSLGTDALPTDLIIALDYSIKHILIDEFQDTSVTQADFLHSLVREWMPGENRSLFAVGDPMQSIYGFREAEVGLFYLAEREGVGRLIDTRQRAIALRAANLETNFRSDGALVDWVNRVFKPSIARETDLATGLVAYAPATSVRRAEESTRYIGTSVHLFQSPGQGHSELAQESQFIARTAHKLLKHNAKDDVAILLRNRTQAPELLRALRDQGLDYQGSELDRLADEPAVRDMLTLARAIARPRDRLANFSLLRSPAVGLSLAALHALARLLRSGSSLEAALTSLERRSDLSRAEREALQRCLSLLRGLRAEYHRQPPRPLLERAWITSGLAAVHGDSRSRQSIEALLALIEAQALSWIDFEALERALRDLYAPSMSESRLTIMTIHQAKGLEFDHVLIPFTSRASRADERPSLRWRQMPEGLLAATRQGSGLDGSIYDWLEHEHKARGLAENERVLYVAVTRARKSLCLTATLPEQAISGAKGQPELTDAAVPRAGTLLAPIWQTVASDAHLHPCQPARPKARAKASETRGLERLPAGWDWQPKKPLTDIEPVSAFSLTANEDELEASAHSGTEPWAARSPIMVGNAVHEALRWLSEHASEQPSEARLNEIRPLIRRWLMREWSGALKFEGLLSQVIRQLERALAHDDCRWILARRSSAQSEADFCALIEGRLVNLRVDRTFVEDGIRYVIDYKTARPRAQESRTEFRTRQIGEHRTQLARYASVFAKIEALPVVAALFLTSTPELVRVPLGP